MNSYLKWSTFLLIVAIPLIFATIFSVGPIITYDHYLIGEAAQSIVQGNGLWAYGRPEAWFPPYIYYCYALFIKYFAQPLNSYTLLQALWMMVTLTLLSLLIFKSTKSYLYTFIGIALVAFDPQWNLTHSWLTADPLFMSLILLFFLAWRQRKWLNRHLWPILIVLMNIAFLTRTLAVVIYLTLLICLIGLSLEGKIKRGLIFIVGILSLFTQACWMLRNKLSGVSSMVGRTMTDNDVTHSLQFSELFRATANFYGLNYFASLELFLGALVFIAINFLIFWSIKKQQLSVVALTISFYLFIIPASYYFFAPVVRWDHAMSFPFLLMATMLLSCFVCSMKTVKIRMTLLALLLLLVCYKAINYSSWAYQQFQIQRQGYFARLANSTTINFYQALKNQSLITISNDAHLLKAISPKRRIYMTGGQQMPSTYLYLQWNVPTWHSMQANSFQSSYSRSNTLLYSDQIATLYLIKGVQ